MGTDGVQNTAHKARRQLRKTVLEAGRMALKLRRLAGALMLAGMATTASAQQATTDNRVGAHVDWSVFEETSPRECIGVSAPKETVNTRDGRVVAVRRSEIRLFVFYRPDGGNKVAVERVKLQGHDMATPVLNRDSAAGQDLCAALPDGEPVHAH